MTYAQRERERNVIQIDVIYIRGEEKENTEETEGLIFRPFWHKIESFIKFLTSKEGVLTFQNVFIR